MGILKYLFLFGLVAAVALVWARKQVDPSPYDYDEADYMFAASRGFLANWSDTPSMSLPEFIQIGLSKGVNPAQSGDLSVLLRDSGDMDGYRHWHGTLYYYGLALAPAGWSERTVRLLSFAASLLGVAVVWAGCLWLWPSSTWGSQGVLAATLSSLLLVWSPAVVKTTEIAPHILFSVVCLATLFAAAKMRETGRAKHWYATLALAGVAFCTMELSFALIFAVLLFGHLERDRLFADSSGAPARFAGKSLAAFLAPVVLLWPVSLYKLNFIKSYLFMAYLAVFRKNPWGDVTFAQTWAYRFQHLPVELGLIALAVVLFLRAKDSGARRSISVFLIFGVIMLAAVLRVNSTGSRYTLPFLAPLVVFTGVTLASAMNRFAPPLRWTLAGLLAAAVFADTARQVNARPPEVNQKTVALLDAVRDPRWKGKTLLVPQGDIPTLHYYAQTVRFRGYYDASSIPARLRSEHFDGVAYPDEAVVRVP